MFTKDIFISYAHIDNQPLNAQKSGWISRFHASLQALLSMRLGKSATIWRDDKLQGNDRFAEEIVGQFDHTAVLVSVVTPRYLNSEWCTREVNEFCKRADANNGLFVDQKARIFKILKTPISDETALPDVMQQLLGYEFFTLEDGVPMELDDAFGEKYGHDFNRKVNKLAFEIAEMLKSITTQPSDEDTGEVSSAPPERPMVYLANCSYDIKDERETVATELRRMGYTVLPDRHLPTDEDAYCNAVQDKLSQCALSVHMIGEHYGAVADGPSQKSQSILQNELAAVQSQASNLERILWVPAHIEPKQPEQLAFVDALHNDSQYQFGADLITSDFATLRQTIHTKLESIERQSQQPTDENDVEDGDAPTGQKKLYLICTEEDRKATVPIRKHFRDAGFNVAMPAFRGEAAEVRRINREALQSSDVIIIFYGQGDEAWKRSIDVEIQKLPVYLNGKAVPQTYTYLASPLCVDKDDLIDMEEPNLINGIDGLDISALEQCVAQITQTESVT